MLLLETATAQISASSSTSGNSPAAVDHDREFAGKPLDGQQRGFDPYGQRCRIDMVGRVEAGERRDDRAALLGAGQAGGGKLLDQRWV